MSTDEIDALYEAIKEESAKATENAQDGNTHMEALHYLRFCSLYMQLLDAKMDEVYDVLGTPLAAMTKGRHVQ